MKTLTLLFFFLVSLSLQSQWIELQSGTFGYLEEVHFPSIDTGYIVRAYSSNVLKTTDGGFNWSELETGTTEFLNSVFFISSDTGFVVGDNSVLLKTTDGGLNWTSLYSGPTIYFNSVFFVNSNVGYIGCGSQDFLKTTDGGNTWTTIPGCGCGAADIYFPTTEIGYLTGFGCIYKSTDGGITWIDQSFYLNSTIRSVFFTDSINGIVVSGYDLPFGGFEGIVKKTVDGGINWTDQSEGIIHELEAVSFYDSLNGFAVGGAPGAIYKTIDGGLTWTHNADVSSSYLTSVCFTEDGTAYAVGREGGIYRNDVAVGNIEGSDYLIFNNAYPNPTNVDFNIDIGENTNEIVSYFIYNSFGSLVSNGSRSFQNGKITLPIEGMKPGLHFYHIEMTDKRISGKIIVAR